MNIKYELDKYPEWVAELYELMQGLDGGYVMDTEGDKLVAWIAALIEKEKQKG